ncbi:SDR family oxidoreductase [Erythrobacter sp. LQ02-29]|uniref:SDR family oxidoreductase n=1 Tax=Erythrobacter sp. LQ02-29 TaxID=2920384 RepID=UPI001F4EFF11|nr:SDR family oxidoreductase [Erythrobacter sp. LQ02-29]MCP9222920.1 SDR family oxidoreductase [Erythrobacter sp. LQ02-29]
MTPRAVLVTGGAKRIGATLSRAFAARGWHVLIHYNSSARAARHLADSLPGAESVQCDLSDAGAASAFFEDLAGKLSDWPLLVNSAAVFEPDTVDSLDEGVFKKAMRVNAQAGAVLAQAFFRHARARSGRRFIQFTDQKIENINPDFFSYTMSKCAANAGIAMLSSALSDPRDRVYGLAPGAILESHDQTEEEVAISHRLNLLRRRTEPAELAVAALFLAEGWLASGQTLFVDSGQHLMRQPRDVIYLARELMGRPVEAARL